MPMDRAMLAQMMAGGPPGPVRSPMTMGAPPQGMPPGMGVPGPGPVGMPGGQPVNAAGLTGGMGQAPAGAQLTPQQQQMLMQMGGFQAGMPRF